MKGISNVYEFKDQAVNTYETDILTPDYTNWKTNTGLGIKKWKFSSCHVQIPFLSADIYVISDRDDKKAIAKRVLEYKTNYP